MPEVSIAIPTYEVKGAGASYLGELFETILMQDFSDFEVCVSDHSQDEEVLDLCGEYANHFTIQYYKNEEDRGNGPANTNSAIEMCSGRITKLIFQDDLFIDKSALSLIKSEFDNSECNWCFNGFGHTTDGVSHFRKKIPEWTDMVLEGRNLLGSPSCVSFLTDKFVGFDEELVLLMDTDFYHRMRYHHGMPSIISHYLISNREHDNRISSSGIEYNGKIDHPSGGWMVNVEELEYVNEKNKDTRNYPDEN